MDIIGDNYLWMTYNIGLALIAVFAALALFRTKSFIIRSVLWIVWLLFIPNTLYNMTDVIHLFEDLLYVDTSLTWLLVIEYIVLIAMGIVTYIYSFRALERMVERTKSIPKTYGNPFLIGVNFLIGFGIVLGRVQRANSWEAITNPGKVIHDSIGILMSIDLLLLSFFFGLLCNIIYFGCKDALLQHIPKSMKI